MVSPASVIAGFIPSAMVGVPAVLSMLKPGTAAIGVTVVSGGLVTGGVPGGPGGVPLTVAELLAVPALTCARVIVWVPVQVVLCPGASVVCGHVAPGASSWASFTVTPVSVTLPVLVTRNEYAIVSPASVTVGLIPNATVGVPAVLSMVNAGLAGIGVAVTDGGLVTG